MAIREGISVPMMAAIATTQALGQAEAGVLGQPGSWVTLASGVSATGSLSGGAARTGAGSGARAGARSGASQARYRRTPSRSGVEARQSSSLAARSFEITAP